MALTDTARDPVYGELARNWKWMLALGVLMVVLGVIGLGMSYTLTIVSVLWFGVLAAVGGVAQLVDAFKCEGWKGVVSHVLLGLLYIGAGVALIALPVQSAFWLTVLIGAVLIATGVLRMVMAVQSGVGSAPFFWLLVSGLLSVVLGVLVFTIVDLPTAEALASVEGAEGWFSEWGWVIGLFVAVEFIVHGASLAALSLAARKVHGDRDDAAARTGDQAPSAV